MRKLLCILLAVLLAGCAAAPAETTISTTVATVPPTTVTTAPTTVATTEAPITAPTALTDLLAGADLEALPFTQLVTVASEGRSAVITLYVLEGRSWQETMTFDGFVGKNGTSDQKKEGDLCTPRGLFPIEEAFYIGDAPQTGLPAFAITEQTYWVDDPDSAYYNQRVEGKQNRDWRSAEHMIRHEELYGYGFVIGYNTENIVPGAGSAIFFHRGDDYTAGCVAAEGEDLLALLAALEAGAYILID